MSAQADVSAPPATGPRRSIDVTDVAAAAARLRQQLTSVMAGREHAIDTSIACFLAGGHVLIEDVPGVGKTVLAQALATSLGGAFRRVQGTADLLPGDVVGGLAPDASGRTLVFRPGAVFANVVMFDELNRANPRAQAALLEVMEEGHVSVDGQRHPVPSPFFVLATQNPLDMVGTYPLGEGAADRFMASLSIGRASAAEELAVVTGRSGRSRLAAVTTIADPSVWRALREVVDDVHVSDAAGAFVVRLLEATRAHPSVVLGASTRAGVSWVQLAKATAAIAGRAYIVPHDVVTTAHDALAHRLIVHGGVADRGGVAASADTRRRIVDECIAAVPAPLAAPDKG